MEETGFFYRRKVSQLLRRLSLILCSAEFNRMSHSLLRNCALRLVDVTDAVKIRQRSFRPQIFHTSNQTANMSSGAGENAGGEKKVEIVWDGKQRLFRTADGKAYLSYSVTQRTSSGEKKQEVLDLQHTFVPSSFRGQGVAALLCVAAFQHAKKNGFLVLPTCSYISDTFLPRNPEWDDVVVKDGTKAGL